MTSCIICGAEGPKYKCPICRARYCSVPCCRAHKGEKRTRTIFLKQLSPPTTQKTTPPEIGDRDRIHPPPYPPFSASLESPCAGSGDKGVHAPLGKLDKGKEEASDLQQLPSPTVVGRSKRAFEEDAEDEDGARLRRKHLLSVATSESIRAALRDHRLVETVIRIDAAVRAEQALDAACEDPQFRKFTEKILNTLEEDDAGAKGI